MSKFIKLLGILAVLVSPIGSAAATTIVSQKFFGTGGSEDFVFSYSTTTPFTLSNLSFVPLPSGGSLLAGTLLPFTTSTGGSLNGTGSLSQMITTTLGTSYRASFAINSLPTGSFGVSVSPVPLPASFPLFAVALLVLGLIGYRATRANLRLAMMTDYSPL
jgi:hypothetical protein